MESTNLFGETVLEAQVSLWALAGFNKPIALELFVGLYLNVILSDKTSFILNFKCSRKTANFFNSTFDSLIFFESLRVKLH